ncbi:MAG: hypothetical protein ACE5KZ_08180 [Candidatus Scalinduaceae bacterium]
MKLLDSEIVDPVLKLVQDHSGPGSGVILLTCPKDRHNHLSNSAVAELPMTYYVSFLL